MSSRYVCFESARNDGFYLGIKARSAVPDAGSITSDNMEAQFTIIVDVHNNYYNDVIKI